jgi:hypothetical protein
MDNLRALSSRADYELLSTDWLRMAESLHQVRTEFGFQRLGRIHS